MHDRAAHAPSPLPSALFRGCDLLSFKTIHSPGRYSSSPGQIAPVSCVISKSGTSVNSRSCKWLGIRQRSADSPPVPSRLLAHHPPDREILAIPAAHRCLSVLAAPSAPDRNPAMASSVGSQSPPTADLIRCNSHSILSPSPILPRNNRKTHIARPTAFGALLAQFIPISDTGSPTISQTPGKSAPPASPSPVHANTSSHLTKSLLHPFPHLFRKSVRISAHKNDLPRPAVPLLPHPFRKCFRIHPFPPASSSTAVAARSASSFFNAASPSRTSVTSVGFDLPILFTYSSSTTRSSARRVFPASAVEFASCDLTPLSPLHRSADNEASLVGTWLFRRTVFIMAQSILSIAFPDGHKRNQIRRLSLGRTAQRAHSHPRSSCLPRHYRLRSLDPHLPSSHHCLESASRLDLWPHSCRGARRTPYAPSRQPCHSQRAHLSLRLLGLTTILESALPAVGIAFLTSGHLDPAYRPLASPATLFFFIFIILSILRLNPRLCWLSGLTATVTYLVAAVHLGWSPPVPGSPAPITQTDVTLYAVILLLAGFVAGGVAKEIRKHVEAALREAETKQQLARLQHDLQTARDIQQSLLPADPPILAGFSIAGWNKPADDTGGDYYDWCPLPDGRWIVTLADVTGHGIGPALIAAACRAYSRANFRTHSDLSGAICRVNDAIARDLDPTRFITYVGAACKPGTGDLEVLSAGHGPLFCTPQPTTPSPKSTRRAFPSAFCRNLLPDLPPAFAPSGGSVFVDHGWICRVGKRKR